MVLLYWVAWYCTGVTICSRLLYTIIPSASRKQSVYVLNKSRLFSEPQTDVSTCPCLYSGADTEVILTDGKTVTVTKPPVCPLSVWWDSEGIARDIWRIFLHFDKERTPRSSYGEIKVTGGSRSSLALLKNDLFRATVVPYVKVEVRLWWFIYHMWYLWWYLQQQCSVKDTWKDGAFRDRFAKSEKCPSWLFLLILRRVRMWKAMLVCQWIDHFGPDWNITIEWIAMRHL